MPSTFGTETHTFLIMINKSISKEFAGRDGAECHIANLHLHSDYSDTMTKLARAAELIFSKSIIIISPRYHTYNDTQILFMCDGDGALASWEFFEFPFQCFLSYLVVPCRTLSYLVVEMTLRMKPSQKRCSQG